MLLAIPPPSRTPPTHPPPPALQTITVLYRHGESEMSTLLFTQYLTAVITLPAWSWLNLRIIAATATEAAGLPPAAP